MSIASRIRFISSRKETPYPNLSLSTSLSIIRSPSPSSGFLCSFTCYRIIIIRSSSRRGLHFLNVMLEVGTPLPFFSAVDSSLFSLSLHTFIHAYILITHQPTNPTLIVLNVDYDPSFHILHITIDLVNSITTLVLVY